MRQRMTDGKCQWHKDRPGGDFCQASPAADASARHPCRRTRLRRVQQTEPGHDPDLSRRWTRRGQRGALSLCLNSHKKRGRGENLCLSDSDLNYKRLPYGLTNWKNIRELVMLFV